MQSYLAGSGFAFRRRTARVPGPRDVREWRARATVGRLGVGCEFRMHARQRIKVLEHATRDPELETDRVRRRR